MLLCLFSAKIISPYVVRFAKLTFRCFCKTKIKVLNIVAQMFEKLTTVKFLKKSFSRLTATKAN